MRRAREGRDGAFDLDGVAHVDRADLHSEGRAIAWMTPNWAIAAEFVGSRRTATRVTSGAISLSSSSHFPPMLYSEIMKPVVLPPGRARLPDDAGADWIADDWKDDRHAAGRLL